MMWHELWVMWAWGRCVREHTARPHSISRGGGEIGAHHESRPWPRSGNQRKARALVSAPKFIVADESVAALDVSIQADVLNLLKQIQSDNSVIGSFCLSPVGRKCAA